MTWNAVSVRLHSKAIAPEGLAELVGAAAEQSFNADDSRGRAENTAVFGSRLDSRGPVEDKLEWVRSVLDRLNGQAPADCTVDLIVAVARSSDLREFVLRPPLLLALANANAELNVFLEEDLEDEDD